MIYRQKIGSSHPFGITDQLPKTDIQFSPLPFRAVIQEARQSGFFGSLQDKLLYRAEVGGLPLLADGNQWYCLILLGVSSAW